MRLRVTALAAVTAIGAVILGAGCGSSNDDNSTSSTGTTAAGGALTATPGINVAKDDAIASAAASAVQNSGQLTVASDATYPPMEFFAADNNTTVIGADADISKALGQIMGLEAKVEMDHAALYCSLPGNKWFASWLLDDCGTYPLAAAEGMPAHAEAVRR
jgi:polar amino acid transport system substrate-binding protein